uniref:Ankyrinlike protein putative n=1 Tax=Albugo laibachii Nc14 TaxID=890382 RepID=F0WS59_9STRA|nr:ankyrinlike protein putative [Albugo laibachii Nc14]|eukprot:CCA24177.1 ankyrinlike protein putative [Albugo laibachii Nc14]
MTSAEGDIGMFWRQAQDLNEQTALHIAARFGRCETIRLLLKSGVAASGHVEACRILVSFGFLVDCYTTRGRTPLMYAAKGNHVEVVKYLVGEGGANVNEKNENGASSLYIASHEGHIETVKLLLSLGADVNSCNRTCHTSLHVAVAEHHGEVATYLINAVANKNAVDATGVSIWHEAAGAGSLSMIGLLLRNDVVLDSHTQFDKISSRHPFHYAVLEGHLDFAEAMLVRGLIDVNLQDCDECTAVYYAATTGRDDILSMLLKHRGDPSLASVRRTALHCAVEWKQIKCVKLLVNCNCVDMHAKDLNGRKCLQIAKMKGYDEISVLLEGAPRPLFD